MPPGWRPADVAARYPQPALEISQVRRHEVVVPMRVQALAAALFGLVQVATLGFQWVAHTLAALWGVGRLLEGRRPLPTQAEVGVGTEAAEVPTSDGRASR
jgi:hypothetical protein